MFLQVKSLCEVQDFLNRWPVRPRAERIKVTEACRRISFSDIFAPFPLPPFDKSLMDGYAVIARDTFKASEKEPVILKIKERVDAGKVPRFPLSRGWVTYVATGACLPKNADGVVMVENTKPAGDEVAVMRSAAPGENVLETGSDFKKGELLFKRGKKLTSRHMGLLSSFGFAKVEVYRKPHVAIISSGNEIVKTGKRLKEGKVYDINGPTLASYVEQAGGHADFLGIARDNKRSIGKMLLDARHYDFTLFSAGASAGNRDLLSSVIEEMGKIHFHGIAIKPGKPTIIGEINGRLLFGLPGNPTSCLVTFFLLVVPHLTRFTGQEAMFEKKTLMCADRIFSAKGKMHLVSVKIESGKACSIDRGSGAYSTFFGADGFAVIPEEVEYVEAGERVEVMMFGDRHDG